MKNRIFPLLFIVVISLLLYLISARFLEEEIIAFVDSAGIFAPIVYIFLTLVTLVVAPLSGIPLAYAGFFAFGQRVIFLILATTYISYVINFWIARKWGRRIVRKLVGTVGMKKIDDLTTNYGLVMLVLLRIFLGSIGDFVSLAMGLTNMKFKKYFLVSLLASIPGSLLWYYLSLRADSSAQFIIISMILTLTLSIVFILGEVVWKKLQSPERAGSK